MEKNRIRDLLGEGGGDDEVAAEFRLAAHALLTGNQSAMPQKLVNGLSALVTMSGDCECAARICVPEKDGLKMSDTRLMRDVAIAVHQLRHLACAVELADPTRALGMVWLYEHSTVALTTIPKSLVSAAAIE